MTIKIVKKFFIFIFICEIIGCDLGPNPIVLGSSGTGISISPVSTTLGINQNITFQVTGGTAPYQFQVNGVGSISSSGVFQAGATAGQATIQAADTTGLTGTASVSVVQSLSNIASKVKINADSLAQTQTSAALLQGSGIPTSAQGWQPVPGASPSPFVGVQGALIQGQEVGSTVSQLDGSNNYIKSKFYKTDLKHPLVRTDQLVEGNRVVAYRNVVEDQFIFSLSKNHTEDELSKILSDLGGHISKKIDNQGTYLISVNKKGEPAVESPTPEFVFRRKSLKNALQLIGVITLNTLSQDK